MRPGQPDLPAEDLERSERYPGVGRANAEDERGAGHGRVGPYPGCAETVEDAGQRLGKCCRLESKIADAVQMIDGNQAVLGEAAVLRHAISLQRGAQICEPFAASGAMPARDV